MNARQKAPSILAVVTLLAAAAAAESATGVRERLLVTTEWLAAHLNDPDLVLLHVGDKAEYEAAHLPGARLVSLREISTGSTEPTGIHLEMPPAEELRSKLQAIGISDSSRVVVYWGKDWISPVARILFTLDYAGLGARAALLDGGQPLWAQEGRLVTAEVPASKTGSLSSLATRSTIVDADFVDGHRAMPGFSLVDARNAEFYDGSSTGGPSDSPHRRGHIAGAKTLPFSELLDEKGLVRSNEDLAQRFAKAGVSKGDSVVTYCHIGQQATATLLAARLAGFETRLYDGSFEEWTRRPGAAVESPSAPAAEPVEAGRP